MCVFHLMLPQQGFTRIFMSLGQWWWFIKESLVLALVQQTRIWGLDLDQAETKLVSISHNPSLNLNMNWG